MALPIAMVALSANAGERGKNELRQYRADRAEAVVANLREDSAVRVWHSLLPEKHGYAVWAESVFTPAQLADPAISVPEATTGVDGLSNLEKYALGLEAHGAVTADMFPETDQLDEHFFLWYRRPSDTDDVEYRVEISTDDGASWSSAGVTQEPILADEFAESWQAHYQAAPGQRVWLRLVLALR